MEVEQNRRVMIYVDGFNLYNGLKEYWQQGNENYYWLNLQALGENLLKQHEHLEGIRYFTTFVNYHAGKEKKQRTYIKALHTISILTVHSGVFQRKETICDKCGYLKSIPIEKQTDVQIGSYLISDAVDEKYDVAYIISGDTDLIPAIEAVRHLRPTKEIVVVFPPNRATNVYERIVPTTRKLLRGVLSRSQFQLDLKDENGFEISCPQDWRNPA